MLPSPPTPPQESGHTPELWWALDDLPARPLPPLLWALCQTEVHRQAQVLTAALGLADPDGLCQRLLGQAAGRPALHRDHLRRLSAPLTPPQRQAFSAALGTSLGTDEPDTEPVLPERRLRLHPLPLPKRPFSQPPGSPPPATVLREHPATHLTRALHDLGRGHSVIAAYNAALGTAALRSLTWHWLQDTQVLHLELLCGLDGAQPEGQALAFHAAQQHVLTTLSGGRRTQARTLIAEVRAAHLTQQRYLQEQDHTRQRALRACVQAAAALRDAGDLFRLADARWLTPTELRDALDGTLPPSTLQLSAEVRREQHAELAPAGAALLSADVLPAACLPAVYLPAGPSQPRQLLGRALAPGVRDGPLHLWQEGQPVPPQSLVLCNGLWPAQLPLLADAAALVVQSGTEHSRLARFARDHQQSAVSVQGVVADWLEPGALLRVNGHDGTVTLLRRAGEAPPRPGLEPFDLDLAVPEQPASSASRSVPSLNLDFELG